MASLKDGALPRNNLEEHLARYYKSGNKEKPDSIATTSPLALPRKLVLVHHALTNSVRTCKLNIL